MLRRARCAAHRSILHAILAALAAGVLAAGAVSAERVRGTSATLDPPGGFSAATRFSGFQQESSGASIVVTELPGPASEVTAAMTGDGLATQGMRLLESSEVTAGGRNGLLLHVAESVSGIEFEKWMLALGERNRTLLVVGTFPKEAGELLREPVRAAVLSVRWTPQLEKVRTEGLPFTISETPELRLAQRVNSALLLGKPGTGVKVDPADPLCIVGTSLADIAITDVENFARDRVKRSSEIADLSGISGENARVDGLDAYELVADARDPRTGTPLRVYQLVVADGTRYFLVQGLVGASQADRFVPQFRQVGRSLKRRGR